MDIMHPQRTKLDLNHHSRMANPDPYTLTCAVLHCNHRLRNSWVY